MHKEENAASPKEQESKQEKSSSQDTTSKSTPDETSSTESGEKKTSSQTSGPDIEKVQRAQMIALLLSDVVLSYRTVYLDWEVSGYEEMLMKQRVAQGLESKHKNNRDYVFNVKESVKKDVSKFANRKMSLNALMEEEISYALLGMHPDDQKSFKANAHIFARFADEFSKAKNLNHLLSVVQMYNKGVFDDFIKNKTNEQTRAKESNPVSVDAGEQPSGKEEGKQE